MNRAEEAGRQANQDWTRDRPTVSGFYGFRDDKPDTTLSDARTPTIVEVDAEWQPGRLAAWHIGVESHDWVDEMSGSWWGPIVLPAPPAEAKKRRQKP